MGKATMGRVTIAARIENVVDLLQLKAGTIGPDQVRSIEVDDALVNTGSKLLSLPKRFIRQLGLEYFETRKSKTAAGIVRTKIYRAVWLTVEGRQCTVDVAEVPNDCPVLLGYVPFELLDLAVDPVRERLILLPAEGGPRVLDLF